MNPKEIVAYNLQKLLDRNGKTQTEMAKDLNYPEMTVSNWIKAKTYPRVDKLQEMADYFGVYRSGITELKQGNADISSNSYTYYPASISAGNPFELEAIMDSEQIKIPNAFMGKYANNKNIFFLKTNGDSMDRIIPDQSLIGVLPVNRESLKNGDIVVFSNGGEYSVKYFFKSNEKLIFKPHSTNLEHHEQHYPINSNEIEIYGKVVIYNVILD